MIGRGAIVDSQTDVLIIGAGAAGLTAALAAHEAGASVQLIEKQDRLGGTAAISGGVVWLPDHEQMAAQGKDDSAADALAYFLSLDHGEMDEEVLAAFVTEARQMHSFLTGIDAIRLTMMPDYPDYYEDRPGAKTGGRSLDNDLFDFTALGEWKDRVFQNGPAPRMMLRETPLGGGSDVVDPADLQQRANRDLRGWGQALVGRLLKACLDRGIEPVLGCGGYRLCVEQGRVTGAIVEREGQQETMVARQAVILATGGFEWNEALKHAFLRGPLDAPASPPTNRGDGLKMAMAAGASLGNMTSAWWVPTLAVPETEWQSGEVRNMPVLIERTLPHGILVNREGKRFCNEAANYSALAGAFHRFEPATYDYPNMPAYLVFDSHYRERYPLASFMPGTPLPDWVAKAETLDELADKTGIDAGNLPATVNRFNDLAERLDDQDFGRGKTDYDRFYGDRSRNGAAATLGALTKAPFYAVEIKMGALGTNGGPKTNAQAQILDVDGQPIAGLFGAGNVISAPTGSVYAGAGGTLGPALTFGYIAGRAAAKRVNQ
ncbi:MAG: 3-oxosteroid 1-dehydrogenase [Parasphingorhabdus sp.]|jgi:3-oxosteroid 1-dehydrogenase|uniref:FAD-dependent oxidoreductase n=1 Tax=Parasphingorhabdus sp. TaxID=2709688 RepID=UPI0039E64FDB